MKILDITFRLEVPNDTDESDALTLAADLREALIENGAQDRSELKIVSVALTEKQ